MWIGHSDQAAPEADESCGIYLDAGIAERLRAARTHHGWTQGELAVRSGVIPDTIDAIEHIALESARGSELMALADALEVTFRWLLLGQTPADELAEIVAERRTPALIQ